MHSLDGCDGLWELVSLLNSAERCPGLGIPAVTMAAAARVMRARVRETGGLVKVRLKESHCRTEGAQGDIHNHKSRPQTHS